ncbi:hypothetical protein [Acinetobacter sp. CIP 101966]|uniref:hypothetical protein n=1 Tax=Acinetobacter sp. CIP 101966 TaxID=1144662 RepID=UPI0014866A60|nr:hypothetical protein [Acinetobacter sp. CIP 101966]
MPIISLMPLAFKDHWVVLKTGVLYARLKIPDQGQNVLVRRFVYRDKVLVVFQKVCWR